MREVFLLTDHRWSSAPSVLCWLCPPPPPPPVHLKSPPPRALGRRVCKHVVCGLSGEISVIGAITHGRRAPFRPLYRFFLAFISFCAFLLLNLPEFFLFHLSCKLQRTLGMNPDSLRAAAFSGWIRHSWRRTGAPGALGQARRSDTSCLHRAQDLRLNPVR